MKRGFTAAGLVIGLFLLVALLVAVRRPASSDGGVARVGSRTISLADVDEAWRESDISSYTAAIQALDDGRRNVLEGLIAQELIQQAAAAKEMTVEDFTSAEMRSRMKQIAESDIEAFYNANPDQMGGKSLDAMRTSIRSYLEQQQPIEARRSLVAELRRTGPPIEIRMPPLRHEVEVASDDPVRGSPTAPVTIVEFSDYQCPFCRIVAPTLRKLVEDYGDRVKLVYKDLPIVTIHAQAAKAAEAAHCAGDQGRYWEYHDALFANQGTLDVPALKKYAAALQLDDAQFTECIDSGRHAAVVSNSLERARAMGLDSTPTIFINGRMIAGAYPYERFASLIDEELR